MAERKCFDRLKELTDRIGFSYGKSSWTIRVVVVFLIFKLYDLPNGVTRKLCITKRFLGAWRCSNYLSSTCHTTNSRASKFCYHFKTEDIEKELYTILKVSFFFRVMFYNRHPSPWGWGKCLECLGIQMLWEFVFSEQLGKPFF